MYKFRNENLGILNQINNTMNYLIIFNFLVNIIIIGYICYKKNPFYISVNKTFWCRKVVSLTLMRYTHREKSWSSSKGVFTLPIRNYKKMEEWDTQMLRSGEYKRYRDND